MESFIPASPDSILMASRLGRCEVCNVSEAKYTCPKCEIKTCCLNCLKIHKKALDCEGIRNRTKFIAVNKMTKINFMSDYYFLEECTRFLENRKNYRIRDYSRYKKIPIHLLRLRDAASQRNINLRFMMENFSRRKQNTTIFSSKSKTIFWRVEWTFTNALNIKFVDKRCSEKKKISELLDKYINPDCAIDVPEKKYLEHYWSKGINNLHIFLKSEETSNRSEYYALNYSKSIQENLMGIPIVEYPRIYVTYDKLPTVSDVNYSGDAKHENISFSSFQKIYEKKVADCTNLQNSKNIHLKKRLKRKEIQKESCNFLFNDEKFNIFSFTDSENDDFKIDG